MRGAPSNRILSGIAKPPSRGSSSSSECYDAGMDERVSLLLDREYIDEIRHVERLTGRHGVLSGFVRTLEGNLAGFGAKFSDCIASADMARAPPAPHTPTAPRPPLP